MSISQYGVCKCWSKLWMLGTVKSNWKYFYLMDMHEWYFMQIDSTRFQMQWCFYRSVVKNSPEMVRASLLPFFNNAADDLAQVVDNLNKGRFSHVKGTITRGATSLDYVHMVLLPVLSSMFDHLGVNNFGPDLIGKISCMNLHVLFCWSK